MAGAADWTAYEQQVIAEAGLELLERGGQGKTDMRRQIAPLLRGRSDGSIERKLQNVSYVLALLGLGEIPGYRGLPNIQHSLVPVVRREAIRRGLLPGVGPDFAAMAIYAGLDAQVNVQRGLSTRTWGFPTWDETYRLQPSIGSVIIATNFSLGSPRVPLEEWEKGTVEIYVCRFVGPFRAGSAPHWPDELAEGVVKYPCRFGIEPVEHIEKVSLAADGPLGAISDAIRRSAANRGLGKLVVSASLDLRSAGKTPGTVPDVPDLTDDMPQGSRRRRGLGRLSDPAIRKATEVRAMDAARTWFEERGWSMEDTSATRPWDFEASRDGEVARVEVKGTSGVGSHVELTIGEVVSAQTHSLSALVVVSDIRIEQTEDGPVGRGGSVSVHLPWNPRGEHLRAMRFEYRVPELDQDDHWGSDAEQEPKRKPDRDLEEGQ